LYCPPKKPDSTPVEIKDAEKNMQNLVDTQPPTEEKVVTSEEESSETINN
jgi:hypothetical protein